MRLCVLGSSRLTVTVSWTTTVEHGSLKKERRGPLVATDSGESPTALMASPLIAFQKNRRRYQKKRPPFLHGFYAHNTPETSCAVLKKQKYSSSAVAVHVVALAAQCSQLQVHLEPAKASSLFSLYPVAGPLHILPILQPSLQSNISPARQNIFEIKSFRYYSESRREELGKHQGFSPLLHFLFSLLRIRKASH